MNKNAYIFSYLLVLLTLLQSANLTMIRFNFELNRDFITKNLCVNRFNPESDCGGSCILMKKIKHATEKEANQKAVFNPVLTFVFYFQESTEIDFTQERRNDKKHQNYFKHRFWKEPFIDLPDPPPINVA